MDCFQDAKQIDEEDNDESVELSASFDIDIPKLTPGVDIGANVETHEESQDNQDEKEPANESEIQKKSDSSLSLKKKKGLFGKFRASNILRLAICNNVQFLVIVFNYYHRFTIFIT